MSSHEQYLLPVLGDISSIIMSHHNAVKNAGWSGAFNIMVWLQSPIGLAGEINLELCYQDSRGRHTVIIDKCTAAGKHILLLSSRAIVTVRGGLVRAQLQVVSQMSQPQFVQILESVVAPAGISVEFYLKQSA